MYVVQVFVNRGMFMFTNALKKVLACIAYVVCIDKDKHSAVIRMANLVKKITRGLWQAPHTSSHVIS